MKLMGVGGARKVLVVEFSKKWGVPKNFVYECSFKTPTRIRNICETDVPENELHDIIVKTLSQRVEYYNSRKEKAEKLLEVLGG